MHIFGGDPLDVGTGDADIGKLAVAQMRQLAPYGFMAPPSLIKASK